MEQTVTYRFLGIPLWSVTRKTNVADEEAVYERMRARFSDEMQASLEKVRTRG